MRTTLLLILAAASLAPLGCRRTTVVERPVVTERSTVIERQPATVIERQPTTVIERQPVIEHHDHYVKPNTTVIDRRPGSTTVIERRP
jgi:hypothetical protein